MEENCLNLEENLLIVHENTYFRPDKLNDIMANFAGIVMTNINEIQNIPFYEDRQIFLLAIFNNIYDKINKNPWIYSKRNKNLKGKDADIYFQINFNLKKIENMYDLMNVVEI